MLLVNKLVIFLFLTICRICSMLQTLPVDLYYWMACMESVSGRGGKSIIPKPILGIDGLH